MVLPSHYGSHENGGEDEVFGVVPVGTYLLWDSRMGYLPSGWQVADGTNGTIDMRDRVGIGAGTTYAEGDMGGAATSTEIHTNNHDPAAAMSHTNNHVVATDAVITESGAVEVIQTLASHADHPTHTHDGHDDHLVDTLPPYAALTWIVRIR